MTLALLLHSAPATGKFLASEDIILRAGCLSGLFPQIYLSHVADAALSLSPKKELLIFLDLETTHSVFLESYLRLWNCSTPRDVWRRLSLMSEDGYIGAGVGSWTREPSICPRIICPLLLALARSFLCLHELLYRTMSRESTHGRLSVLRNTYQGVFHCLMMFWGIAIRKSIC